MDFYIGQRFTDVYPPAAAEWCNNNNAVINEDRDGYVIEKITIPKLSEEELFISLRANRLARLAATDYLLMLDYPIRDETLVAVKEYRQALRDLPAQEGAPWDGGFDDTPWPSDPMK